MGGRGQLLLAGGFTEQKFEVAKDKDGNPITIAGHKVIQEIGNLHKGLPEYSNSPNAIYLRQGLKGDITQIRIYDDSRRSHIDFDLNHSHNKIGTNVTHIHKYTIGPNGHPHRGEGQFLSEYYIEKYGELIKKIKPSIKLKP